MTHLATLFAITFANESEIQNLYLHDKVIQFATRLDPLFSVGLPSTVAFSSTYLMDGKFSIDFVAKAVTGLLQTGSAVVCGLNLEILNEFIDTLSFFLPASERGRIVRASIGRTYVPDFIIQGILGRPPPEEQLLNALISTTVIDLKAITVQRLPIYNEYLVLRKRYRDSELEKLSKKASPDNIDFSTQSMLSNVRTAPCVVQMFKELMFLSPNSRENYLELCLQRLLRRSIVVIKYVEAELHRSKDNIHLPDILRSNLDLTSEDDYWVVLYGAEKLCPGIYCKVENPDTFLDRVNDFFSGFGGGP